MLNTVWLDYDELAARFDIARESARQHAKRKRWPRRKANDGRVQVGVPEEALPSCEPVHDPVHNHGSDPVHDRGPDPNAAGYMNRYIEKLEQALAEAQEKNRALEQERDAARDTARSIERERDAATAQVEALKAVLAAERERSDEWKAVADRFALQAEALVKAQAELAAKARPWWRRAFG